MAGELVDLAAFFVEPHPAAALLNIVVLDLHLNHGADAGKGVAHERDERAIPEPDELSGVDRIEQCPHLLGRENGGLALLDAVPRSPDRMRRVGGHHLARHQPVEQHPDSGEVLLDRGLGELTTKLLYICSHVNWLDLAKEKMTLLAPGGKFRRRDEIGAARVPVANVGREKFPKALAGGFGAEEEAGHVAGTGAHGRELAARDRQGSAQIVGGVGHILG